MLLNLLLKKIFLMVVKSQTAFLLTQLNENGFQPDTFCQLLEIARYYLPNFNFSYFNREIRAYDVVSGNIPYTIEMHILDANMLKERFLYFSKAFSISFNNYLNCTKIMHQKHPSLIPTEAAYALKIDTLYSNIYGDTIRYINVPMLIDKKLVFLFNDYMLLSVNYQHHLQCIEFLSQ